MSFRGTGGHVRASAARLPLLRPYPIGGAPRASRCSPVNEWATNKRIGRAITPS